MDGERLSRARPVAETAGRPAREMATPRIASYAQSEIDVGQLAADEGPVRRDGTRFWETMPGVVSWLVLLAPIWLTLLNPLLGILFVTVATTYFASRLLYFGVYSLFNRRRVLRAGRRDWLADLRGLDSQEWRRYRVTLLIRAFREGNRQMLRETLDSIYASNWPKVDGRLHNVEVVFATEEGDPITPPLVGELADEFAGRLVVRQIRHPEIPGHLPGPSSAMNYAGKVLYLEALREGFPPHYQIVADFDCDTLFHAQYLPCLAYHYATDKMRHRHAYQPVVLFTTSYWHAPLHSRLAALGSSVLTLGWNRKPEIAFTGAAASLALLRSVDFWPTNSHSQDSGVEVRLGMRYGRDFKVVGLPLPLWVYPVMVVGPRRTWRERVAAYLRSYRALFRQSARWREGPLDEVVETALHRKPRLFLRKLKDGVERDTLTVLPGAGPLAATAVLLLQSHGGTGILAGLVTWVLTIILAVGSLVSLASFLLLWNTEDLMRQRVPFWRQIVELALFWAAFSVYVPIMSSGAGLKTSTAYMFGQRPRGHYDPTPK